MFTNLATIIGSSSCLVSFAVSLLLTNADSGRVRFRLGTSAFSLSDALSLYSTLRRRNILA